VVVLVVVVVVVVGVRHWRELQFPCFAKAPEARLAAATPAIANAAYTRTSAVFDTRRLPVVGVSCVDRVRLRGPPSLDLGTQPAARAGGCSRIALPSSGGSAWWDADMRS
jgi:hypothetical protein